MSNQSPIPSPDQLSAAAAVTAAAAAWSAAPIHVKALAGAYVLPLLQAIKAINLELQAVKAGR
jgi:hypothetical protein